MKGFGESDTVNKMRIFTMSERPPYLLKDGAFIQGRQSRHVFDHDGAGPQLFSNTKKLLEQTVAGVPEFPLSNDAEALARRPANQQIQFTGLDSCGIHDFSAAEPFNIRAHERNMRKVPAVGQFASCIMIRTEDNIKAGVAKSKSDAPRSGEQVDSLGASLGTRLFRFFKLIKIHYAPPELRALRCRDLG